MKRRIFIFGSILAIGILILAGFSSVTSARTIERDDLIQQIKENIDDGDWYPGHYIIVILVVLWMFLTGNWLL